MARAPSRTISSSNDPPAALFSLDASASWTTLSMGVPSRTSASTPALDQTYLDLQIILGKVRPFTSPGRGPSTSSDHCSDGQASIIYLVDVPSEDWPVLS